MVKNHLKRLVMPRTWQLKRKTMRFIVRPKAGKQQEFTIALATVLKELIPICATTKEVKAMLNEKKVMVAGKLRHNIKYPVGLFDVVTLLDTKQSYRLVMSNKGKLKCIAVKDAEKELCMITDKTTLKGGKVQLNCFNGRNILVDKDEYKTGDVLLIESNKITKHIKLEKDTQCVLLSGKHGGQIGTIESISDHTITIKSEDGTFDTLREYAFVVGKSKPEVQIGE